MIPEKINCTMIFIDLVGSSQHSKLIEISEYAKRIQSFHKTMEETHKSFIKIIEERATEDKGSVSKDINLRGDEAFVYFTTDASKYQNTADIEFAIKLALQMKFEWKLEQMRKHNDGKAIEPKQHMDLAVGINQGVVAGITNQEGSIDGIEGYEINYAKRVESYSRIGKFTNVFLSEKARNVFKNVAILFEKYEDCNLRGLEDHTNLFEVKEFLFDDVPYNIDDEMTLLLNTIKRDILPGFNKTWLEQYLISIFNTQFLKGREHYKDDILDLIKNSHHRDLIFYKFLKAYFLEDELFLLKLQYYQEIVKERPTFILARKEIIRLYEKVCDKLNKLEPLALSVKNYIDEMTNFNNEIIEKEERELYDKILSKINSLLKEI